MGACGGGERRGEATANGGGDGDGARALAGCSANSATPRLKILVVSPSSDIREETVATLQAAGHRVSCAGGDACARGGVGKKKKKNASRFLNFLNLPKKKKKKNKQARSTSTSSRALKLLASKPENAGFDLVLKDHDPPKASARRFLAALRRNRRAIPVVVLSSSAAAASTAARDADAAMQGDNAKKCLAAGAADVLSGPLSLDECSNLYARVFWWRRVSQLLER